MTLYMIGCSSGIAGADINTGDGPIAIRQSSYLRDMENANAIHWQKMLEPTVTKQRKDSQLQVLCTELAQEVSQLTSQKKKFCVMGGDHSCAIGTWSGVYDALHQQGEFGLIWIDAHMDAHTPETTPTGNIHGMPVACLLGFGYPTLTGILHDAPKIKPENICMIGVRSFEAGEAALLEKLKVKIYYMEEVDKRGFNVVLEEAIEKVSKHTVAFGATIDIDSIDPQEAPGVDVPEQGGIKMADLLIGLKRLAANKKLIGTEIVEFDPARDQQQKTEKIVVEIIKTMAAE